MMVYSIELLPYYQLVPPFLHVNSIWSLSNVNAVIYHHAVCAKKGFIDGICSHISRNSYYLAPGLAGAYQYQYEDTSYKQFCNCIHTTPVHRAASHDLLRTSPCSRLPPALVHLLNSWYMVGSEGSLSIFLAKVLFLKLPMPTL